LSNSNNFRPTCPPQPQLQSPPSTTTITARQLLPIASVKDSWYEDLVRDEYAIVMGAIPRERADQNASDMYPYLDGFNPGFDRNDPSTVQADKLPLINNKGMCMRYAVNHEDFAWKVRSEAGVIDAFTKAYQTEDHIVSFDAVNFGFSNRKDLPPNTSWPHQDQDRTKPGFRCLQGPTARGLGTPHYNLSSKSARPCFCAYTCYMPLADVTTEDLQKKKAAFEREQSKIMYGID
ncbi:hypothetical protein LTR72_011798, partial [Exophiala xenobiotica]